MAGCEEGRWHASERFVRCGTIFSKEDGGRFADESGRNALDSAKSDAYSSSVPLPSSLSLQFADTVRQYSQ